MLASSMWSAIKFDDFRHKKNHPTKVILDKLNIIHYQKIFKLILLLFKLYTHLDKLMYGNLYFS
jgi:hypothetical protein